MHNMTITKQVGRQMGSGGSGGGGGGRDGGTYPSPPASEALEDEVGEVGLEDEDQCHVHVEGLHRHPAQRRQQREVQQHGHDLKQRNDSRLLNVHQ